MAMLLQVACQRVPATHTTLTRAPLHGCRGGLSARPRQDHLQIHIDPCSRFDYDDQLAALRGDVAKIKQVRFVLAAAAPEGGGGGGRNAPPTAMQKGGLDTRRLPRGLRARSSHTQSMTSASCRAQTSASW
jgi:hypothetical protein